MSDKKSAILKVAKGLTENYASEELFMPKSGRRLPLFGIKSSSEA